MMKIVTQICLVVVVMGFLISGCKDDSLDVRVSMHLVYDGQPLVMLQDYTYPDGRKIQFTRFSMYLSDVRVFSGSESVELAEVDFVNLTASHADAASAAKGFLYKARSVELASIDAISFNVGLTEEQNGTVPADHGSGHPLANPGEYWVAWDSYIFAKVEGWMDLDDDGDAETGLALHMGSNDVRQEVMMSVDGSPSDIAIEIDLKTFFGQDNVYDIDANPQIHSLGQLPAAKELSDNLKSAIHLRPST